MNLRFELEKERKEYLGLTETNTKKIYKIIIDAYNKILLKAPRNVMGYSIDIVICNMNFYNKLGDLEKLNETWGDNNFYVDTNNSVFVELLIDEDGNVDSNKSIYFKDKININDIKDVSFSIKELIDLCQKDNRYLRICAQEGNEYETAIEINPSKSFEMNDSIKIYLETLK